MYRTGDMATLHSGCTDRTGGGRRTFPPSHETDDE
jgi:hypothetical protein